MRVVVTSLISLSLYCSTVFAEELPATTAPATTPQILQATKPTAPPNGEVPEEVAGKPLTAEQIAKNKSLQEAKTKALVKNQETRLQQLEKANLEALAQNQELQLKNDSLGVQVQVLQSERSAQMFLYGATTLAVGVLLGFLIASYVYTKRRRQW